MIISLMTVGNKFVVSGGTIADGFCFAREQRCGPEIFLGSKLGTPPGRDRAKIFETVRIADDLFNCRKP